MTTTATRDAEATKARILRAAMDLFAAKGYADTSTSEMAAAAGVTKSLIHHHFGSKEGLWSAVKERHFQEYFEAQRRLLESSGTAELLERSVKEYFRFLGRHPDFVRLIDWMQLEELDERCLPLGEELARIGVARIREAQEAGEVRSDVHPFSILVSFLGMAEHWYQGKSLHCQGLDPEDAVQDDEEYLGDMLKIFLEGVLPRGRR